MNITNVIMEKAQSLDGYKVIRKQNVIESYNNLNLQFHNIDLSFVKVNIFYNSWLGFRTNKQMKEILEGHFLDFYREHKCVNMLTDCTKMRGSFIDISGWLATTFMPVLAEMGLKNHSIVLSDDTFTQSSIHDFIKKTSQIKTVSFTSLSEALNWLAMEA
jgi:hypothetical protein